MTTFVNWQRYELLGRRSDGNPMMALLLVDHQDAETAYRFSLDEAIELGHALTSLGVTLQQG